MKSPNETSSVNQEYTDTDRLLETPYADRPKSSDTQAFVNTIKSFVGVGILEFPYAVKHSGLWAGVVLLFLIGIVSNYTMKVLIRCKDEIKLRDENAGANRDITFGDVGRYTMGKPGFYIVNFAIISGQIGFCCAYVIFISTNLNLIFPSIGIRYFSLMYFPVFMLLSWLRDIKYLAPTSIFANFTLLFAASVILYHGFTLFKWGDYPAVDPKGLPTFFGIAVFGYEGINLALPIQSSMKNPRHYPRVLDFSMIIVGIAYITFGCLGYICYGNDIKSVITENLPRNTLTKIVQVLLISELTFSYPVQLFPVHTICEERMFTSKTKNRWVKRSSFRTCLVAITVVIAVFIPHFDYFTALVGAFSNSLVTFIFPPIFLLVIFKKNLWYLEMIANVLILVFGLVASSISSYIAVKNIISFTTTAYNQWLILKKCKVVNSNKVEEM